MATNNLDAFIPKVLAMAAIVLRENIILPSRMYSQFETTPRSEGGSVDIALPASMIADDVIPHHNQPESPAISPKKVSVKLDHWKRSRFAITDKEVAEVMDGVIPLQVREGARALANQVDKDLWTLYKTVPNVIGTAGQTPFQSIDPPTQVYHGLMAAKEARRILNLNKALNQDRVMLLNIEAESNASVLPQFLNASASGSTETIREGVIGRKSNFDWFYSNNAPVHVSGTTGTIVTNGSPPVVNAKGSTTLVVSGTTALTIGDKFTIAGDTTQYTINAGSTNTNWLIYPALAADVPTSTNITIYPTGASGADISMAFHPMAFTFANAPMMDVMAGGNTIQSFTDPTSGLSLRLEMTRQYKQTMIELDFLYGFAPLMPELAVVIYG